MKKVHKYSIAGVIAFSVVMVLIGISFFNAQYQAKNDKGIIIAQDVIVLRDAFHKIHKDCIIIDFDDQKNSINFLNVVKFTGSEVGPMNLTYPEKWQGPYMQDNPTIDHIAYQVVSTNDGYFITPGDGVTLPNNKIVGKDIVLDKKANISAMAKDAHLLSYKDKPLAVRLDLGSASKVQFFLDKDEEVK